MKENDVPKAIKRQDYQPAGFDVESVSLLFDLQAGETLVTNTMMLRRNPAGTAAAESANAVALELDGVDLELVSITLNGVAIAPSDYQLGAEQLRITTVPDAFELQLVSRVFPDDNKALEGLYRSGGMYCTQCEAQGFRKITWFPDRPDVLSRYQVTIEAEQTAYPVLLSNGNLVEQGTLENGRHFATWHDPHPKPSYLFALVAGQLEVLSDEFVTRSGRTVALKIYVEAHNLHKCDYAMRALKKSMRWDEDVFGLEYDLDIFMIVAVDHFNMGAMENKGLNIFNSKFVLADQMTATDTDFMGVESVIAHEYFHNWTGNRVTCRDWFQLSLKEGLTVFRDQEFSGDMNSRAVKRIEDVRLLRARQFPEDAGPMAHPIRPDEYIEINNFYTVTVYEKGAEVIRMLHTFLGEQGFRAGIDLYFERFDGQAVTCDDFVDAMQDANSFDLTQFRRWYSQAGTPVLKVETNYDEKHQTLTLSVHQSCPATPNQPEKEAFHLPFRFALIGADGKPVPLCLAGEKTLPNSTLDSAPTDCLLSVNQEKQTWVFEDVGSRPVPSVLRNFSAPVNVELDYSDEELAFLMAHETDSFNRWEAGQRLYCRVIETLVENPEAKPDDDQFAAFNTAFSALLLSASAAEHSGTSSGSNSDPALLAEALSLPGIEAVAESHSIIRVDEIHAATERWKHHLAQTHKAELLQLIKPSAADDVFSVESAAIGRRKLRNTCLGLLSGLVNNEWVGPVLAHYQTSTNMTDRIAALRLLCEADVPERKTVLADFYQQWSEDRLVTDKWFSLQAMATRPDIVNEVMALTRHPAFDLANPNRVRSVIGVFAVANTVGFHRTDGAGYRLLADFILQLDKFNPQIAARLAGPLGGWQRFDTNRRQQMQTELKRIAAEKGLSPDVFEIVSRSLAGAQ
ncbi:MAG: aminopeptidase N [Granulosicoccus sp.]|nr:aminopeptidase N [Granulosicoccus sp.]